MKTLGVGLFLVRHLNKKSFRMFHTPKILSIQSHTVHGYVGNKAATFPLQTLGFNVDCINTISLSNEPAYAGGFKGQTMSGNDLAAIVEGLGNNQLLTHDVILTGYNRTPELLDQIEAVVRKVKEHNPNAIYVCDPVLGDNGKYYVPEALCEKYRTQILPLATAITPNYFEAQVLSGVTVKSFSDAVLACKTLLNFGPQICVLTGLKLSHNLAGNEINKESNDLTVLVAYRSLDSFKQSGDKLEAVASENDIHIYRVDFPRIDNTFSGCGDLFSALFAAGLYHCRTRLSSSPHLLGYVLETVTNAMSAVLLNTKARVDALDPSKELRIVESSAVYRRVGDIYSDMMSNTVAHPQAVGLASTSGGAVPSISSHVSPAFHSAPPAAPKESLALSFSHVALSSHVSGVIFDMDGTLTEGGAIDFDAMYSRTGLQRRKSADILALVAALPSAKQREDAMRIITEEEMLGCDRMVVRPELSAFVTAVKAARLRTALATRNCDIAFARFIEASGVHNETFAPRLFRDSLPGHVNKPSPEVAHHIMREWNIQPGFESSVWFVGDSLDDMMCGKQAGCKTCLIRTPQNQKLQQHNNEGLIDLVVDNLLDFAAFINLPVV